MVTLKIKLTCTVASWEKCMCLINKNLYYVVNF